MAGLNRDCTNDPAPLPELPDLTAEDRQALEAAHRCLGAHSCEACDACRLLCPDLAITRHPETGRIQIDLDYCKGCGICAAFCPRGAIRMELEADAEAA
ncbi:MAG: 4Fe-4S binding protein [Deferrisomatales bacterium]